MADDGPIAFGRAAAKLPSVSRLDVTAVSIGIIVSQFFAEIALLIRRVFDIAIEVVAGVTNELLRIIGGLFFIPEREFPAAFAETTVSVLGLELGPFTLIAGVAVVLFIVWILARGRDASV